MDEGFLRITGRAGFFRWHEASSLKEASAEAVFCLVLSGSEELSSLRAKIDAFRLRNAEGLWELGVHRLGAVKN